jgi:hypothetical protein
LMRRIFSTYVLALLTAALALGGEFSLGGGEFLPDSCQRLPERFSHSLGQYRTFFMNGVPGKILRYARRAPAFRWGFSH